MSTTTWNLDASHSEVGFKVRHLMISNVNGSFGKFTSSITNEGENFETSKVVFEAEMNSFSTNNEQRDGHIKSADFLDADNFPTMKFESNSISKKDDQLFVVHGDLTIKGISKSVDLLVEKSDTAKDPWGQTKIAFDVSTKINRTDFGLVWNAPLESGGVLLSEEVKIQAEVQFVLAQ